MRRNQWLALGVALLIFVCGVVAGVLGNRYIKMATVNAKTAEDFRHHYTIEMRDKLHLSAQQVAELDVILDETKAKYKAVRDSYRPQMLKIKDEQLDRVKDILTPEQIPGYEQLVSEREERYRQQQDREQKEEERRVAAHRAQLEQQRQK